ncbi:MAG: NUDIX domain-containing protein [Jhaorihella sp.]
MPDLFFYGTLRYLPLLERVLGRAAGAIDMQPARLPGHAVYWADGQSFPMIVVDPDRGVDGLVVRGLSTQDIARLEFYEGGFEYDLRPVRLTLGDGGTAHARVFFPPRGADAPRPGAPWSLEEWAAEWGPLTLRAAQEVMAWFGRKEAGEIAPLLPSIRRRAASWLAAQARPPDPARDMASDVRVLDHGHDGLNFFGMERAALRFRRHDGTLSGSVTRFALLVGEAAVVLPYDPVNDCVLLVEQFRAPVFLAGDRAPWVWEPVAGLVDPGETAETTARREAMEEAGLTLTRLEDAGRCYSSTGSSGEFLHLFIGIADLSSLPAGAGGLASEGEDIASRIVGFDDLMRGVDAGEYRDLPLLTTALWLARHRDRLRMTA